MNINEFKQLSAEEAQSLLKAPALITVLIAAADGKIDPKETAWADKIVGYREHVGDEDLYNYYHAVDASFNTQLKTILAEEHVGNPELLASVSARLAKNSTILAKLNKHYADKLFASWKSFAKQIAKADGGFLGFGEIAAQEEHLMDLHMISY